MERDKIKRGEFYEETAKDNQFASYQNTGFSVISITAGIPYRLHE